MEEVNLSLTAGECNKAIELIEDLYNSSYTDNEVRMLRASAHGCVAGISFFPLVGYLSTRNIVGSEFWMAMTEYFPSVSQTDLKAESGWYATDALQAVLDTGIVEPVDLQINPGTNNVGTQVASHRIKDSNGYLMFVSMSTIGAIQNRYGNPTNEYKKLTPLPWSTKAAMAETGCSYASAIVNLLDGIDETQTIMQGSLKNTMEQISSTFGELIDTACGYGCAGLTYDGAVGADAECTYSASECNPCPLKLRTRTSCADDAKSACAAAGIVRFINLHPFGWPDG